MDKFNIEFIDNSDKHIPNEIDQSPGFGQVQSNFGNHDESNESEENEFRKQKKKLSFSDPTIILFSIVLMMEGMWYSIAAPFLPSEADSIGTVN